MTHPEADEIEPSGHTSHLSPENPVLHLQFPESGSHSEFIDPNLEQLHSEKRFSHLKTS